MKEWGVMVDGDYDIPEWEEDMEDDGVEVCISCKEGDEGCGWYDLDKILILECSDEQDYNKAIRMARKLVKLLKEDR